MVHPLFYIRSHQLLLGRVSSLMYPKMGLFLIGSVEKTWGWMKAMLCVGGCKALRGRLQSFA